MSSGAVYEIATKLSMVNGVSGVLTVVLHDLMKVEGSVKALESSFKTLNRTSVAAFGAISTAAGVGLLATMTKLVDKGNEWVRVSRNMEQAGSTAVQIGHAQEEARRLTSVYRNMSQVEIMKMINDARQTFGSQDAATHHIAPFVQMGSFLKAYEGHEKGGKDSESLLRELNAAMKSGEIAGKINPQDMEEHVRQLTAMKVVYGDQVKITDYLTAQRSAGVALRNTSDDFRYGMFPALVQENGSTAGVMLMTAFNKVVAGVGNRTKSLERMYEMGLVGKDDLDWDRAGVHIKGLKNPDAIKNSTHAAMNFGDWVMTTLKPQIERKVDEKGITDPKLRSIYESQLISGMFPDRTAAKAVTEILQQFTKFTKDAENMARARKAMNMDKYTSGSWDYQVEAFNTQLNNLMTNLGGPLVGPATDALKKINDQLDRLNKWAEANPEGVKAWGDFFARVGVGLLAGGSIAMIGSLGALLGPAGAIILGLGGVYATLKLMHDLDWPSFLGKWKPWGESLKTFMEMPFEHSSEGLEKLGQELKNLPDPINDLMRSLDVMWAKIKDVANSILSFFGGGSGGGESAFDRMRKMGTHDSTYWSGVGGGGLGFGLKGAVGTGSGSDMKAIIDGAAARHGIDPRLMYGIVAGESGHGNHYDIGDSGKSHGPFQMYLGGGLGNIVAKQGIDVRHPSSIPATADWVAGYISRTHDMSPWHGFHGKRDWNPRWGNMGYSPTHREVGPPPKSDKQVQVHTDIHMDGRKVATAVTKHMVAAAEHTRQAPYFNGHGMFAAPDHNFAVG